MDEKAHGVLSPSEHKPNPPWLRITLWYEVHFPNHPGKRTILRTLFRLRARSSRPVIWRMRNGTLLAIAPTEAFAPHSIGWRCIVDGAWEPHVERTIRAQLRPGDVAYDIGANLGYFSAVMANVVGPSGRVVAFEPVPETFERLALCREMNGFSQLIVLPVALGQAAGFAEMFFDRRLSGQASIHERTGGYPDRIVVPVESLDELVATGAIPPPTLIKIDVEGHELHVLQGSRTLLARHRPTLIVEINSTTSRAAGWSLRELLAQLRESAPYLFFVIGEGRPKPLDLSQLDLDGNAYFDVLALVEQVD